MSWSRYFLPHVSVDLATAELTACSTHNLSKDDYWHRWKQLVAVTTNLPLVPRMGFLPPFYLYTFLFIITLLRFRKTSSDLRTLSLADFFSFRKRDFPDRFLKMKTEETEIAAKYAFSYLGGRGLFWELLCRKIVSLYS